MLLSNKLKVSFWLIFLIVGLAEFCSGENGSKGLEVSTIVSEAVNYFLEKLQDESNFPHARGGGGGWGHGGHGHGAITLDPVSIISLLALGAFLINNILQLLRANMNNNNTGNNNMPMPPMNLNPNDGTGGGIRFNGRSTLDSAFDNLPFPALILNGLEKWKEDEPGFADFFKNVGSLYYLHPKKRHMCMKRVVCSYVNKKEGREKTRNGNLKNKLFDFMLSTVTKIVAPEMSEADKEEKCSKMQKFCSDSLLNDARVSVEYKVYSKVSGWLTQLAFNGLTGG